MKVLEPSRLMRDAAEVLAAVRDDIVVIGATALEAAMAGRDVRIAATTDVDCAVDPRSAATVISSLEREGLRPSEEPHERGFTWVRDGLKVQLICPPTRITSPPVSLLVTNTNLSLAGKYREPIAFEGSPDEHRMWVARPAAVLALKGHAFGRTRPNGRLVERDYHDAYLLIGYVGEEIATEVNGTDDGQLRGLIRKALQDLQAEPAREAVRRQIAGLEAGVSPREADARLTRAVATFSRRLA